MRIQSRRRRLVEQHMLHAWRKQAGPCRLGNLIYRLMHCLAHQAPAHTEWRRQTVERTRQWDRQIALDQG
jgi:hypothetical protein